MVIWHQLSLYSFRLLSKFHLGVLIVGLSLFFRLIDQGPPDGWRGPEDNFEDGPWHDDERGPYPPGDSPMRGRGKPRGGRRGRGVRRWHQPLPFSPMWKVILFSWDKRCPAAAPRNTSNKHIACLIPLHLTQSSSIQENVKRRCVSCEDVFVVSGHVIEPLYSKTGTGVETRSSYKLRAWASDILAGKCNTRRHSTMIFSENVVLAETSCQMFGGLLFCDCERAWPPSIKISVLICFEGKSTVKLFVVRIFQQYAKNFWVKFFTRTYPYLWL